MSLTERLEGDLVSAIKSSDEFRRDTLRLVKSAIKNQAIELGHDLSDEEAVTIIAKEVKKRKESIEAYNQAGKPELAEQEQKEIDLLKDYLPEQMDEAKIKEIVDKYFETNPKDPSKIGQTIGALSPQFKGKADMGLVSKIVREALQN